MPFTPRPLTALAGLALTLGLVAGGGAARADVTTRLDPPRDGRHSVDIRSVRVDHAQRKVHVRVTPSRDRFWGDFNHVWIDTRPHRPGAEFRAEVNSEGLGWFEVRRVRADHSIGGTTCDMLRVDVSSRVLRVHVPRRCLGTPGRVRVRLVSDSDLGRGDRAGWTRWVRRG